MSALPGAGEPAPSPAPGRPDQRESPREKPGSAPPGGVARSAGVPTTLRAGFEGSGSPRWLMRTMQSAGLDAAHGFRLELVALPEGGHRHGTLQALADGATDLADADRLALAAAQADGLPLCAVAPYGRILGCLVGRRDRPAPAAPGLGALIGARVGALSLADKNWTLLADACRSHDLAGTGRPGGGFDLATCCTPALYRSRAELVAALDAGEVDVALVHWHLVPQLLAAGHRVLAELPDLADALGAGDAATTHFVMRTADVAAQPARVAGLRAALGEAAARLDADEAPWRALAAEGAFAATLIDTLRPRWQARVGRYLTDLPERRTP